MIVNFSYDTDSERESIELNVDELSSVLHCDGIGHNGKYYRITIKIFEFIDYNRELTVFAKYDSSVEF
ncbi:MAG: hypothetical protein ACERKZ_17370 [Lachnotalea sp.]